MILLDFDIEPVAKGRPKFTKQGRAYTPAKTRKFEEALSLLAIAQMRRGDHEMRTGPVVVDLTFSFVPPKSWPDWKREAAIAGSIRNTSKPDLDNLTKCLDAFNGIVFEDDSQISSIVAKKRYTEKSGIRVCVTDSAGLCARTVKKADIESSITNQGKRSGES